MRSSPLGQAVLELKRACGKCSRMVIPLVPRISAQILHHSHSTGSHQETCSRAPSVPQPARRPLTGDQAGHRIESPPRGQRRETGCACRHLGLCEHTPSPQGLASLGKRPGEGSLVSPRMICHCLMRLMSPGGWYAAVLGHSLEADAHGNVGKWGPEDGVRLTRQVVSINLWAGPRVRALPPSPSPQRWGGMRQTGGLQALAQQRAWERGFWVWGPGTGLLQLQPQCLAQCMCSINTCWYYQR